jgi:hypothetical protein
MAATPTGVDGLAVDVGDVAQLRRRRGDRLRRRLQRQQEVLVACGQGAQHLTHGRR